MSIDPEDFVDEVPTRPITASQRRRPRKNDGRAPRNQWWVDECSREAQKQSRTPRNIVPLKERAIFKAVRLLGLLQAWLMRLTGEHLYVSSDGRTMLVSQMDSRHLTNAIKKMKREDNRGTLYDVLVAEAVKRKLFPAAPPEKLNPLEAAYAQVKRRHNQWHRRLWRFLTFQKA